jgi:hypothetical protein
VYGEKTGFIFKLRGAVFLETVSGKKIHGNPFVAFKTGASARTGEGFPNLWLNICGKLLQIKKTCVSL